MPEINPENPPNLDALAQPPGLLQSILGGLLAGASGTTSPQQAYHMGMPEAQGLNPEQLQGLLLAPQRQEQVAALKQKSEDDKAAAPLKRAELVQHTAFYKSMSANADAKPGQFKTEALQKLKKDYDEQLNGKNGILLESMHPDEYATIKAKADEITAELQNRIAPPIKPAKPGKIDAPKATPGGGDGKGNGKGGGGMVQIFDASGQNLGTVADTPANRKLAATKGYKFGAK